MKTPREALQEIVNYTLQDKGVMQKLPHKTIVNYTVSRGRHVATIRQMALEGIAEYDEWMDSLREATDEAIRESETPLPPDSTCPNCETIVRALDNKRRECASVRNQFAGLEKKERNLRDCNETLSMANEDLRRRLKERKRSGMWSPPDAAIV